MNENETCQVRGPDRHERRYLIMVVIPAVVYIVSLIILFFENKYTWAPNILEKPLNYERQKFYWMLIPNLMKWISAAWFFLLFGGWIRIALPVGMIALYSFLNRYFTKRIIQRSIDTMYPNYLDGILSAHKKKALSESELQEKVNYAKFMALQKIWRQATGEEPDAKVMLALIRRLKYPSEFLKYMN